MMMQMSELIPRLQAAWVSTFKTEAPDEQQWAIWLRHHGATGVRHALFALSRKLHRGCPITQDHMMKFLSSVMSNRAQQIRAAADRSMASFDWVVATSKAPDENRVD
jgi:hypothetical protein